MNKIYHFILFCFTALCFTACSDDDSEFSGIEGKDHYISDFALSVGGITYQAAIAGDKITVEIPYNVSLEGATVEYVLSEGASINPNPSTIQNWEDEWKFVVTSKMQESKVYSYTYRYADIEQSGSVVLATQAEVDNFAETGINKIDGNLTIGTTDGEEITNLEGLVNLKQISNTLILNSSYKGTDLSGLNNLEQLGSFKLGSIISTSKNTTLKTVNLPSLLEVVGDFVINSSVVEKISIPKVDSIGGEMYIASDALLDLDANALASVSASLLVKGTTESNPKKGSATTEAIVFASLKHVGNELSFQYFPKLQGVYLPVLEYAGAASFNNLEMVGSIAMTELRSVGDFTINVCSNVANVSLPALATSGKMYISAPVDNLDISSLKNINGEMNLRVVNLTALDVSAIDFNGNMLNLYSCDLLSKITGPETFNGSFMLNGSDVENFTIEGISNVQGDFEFMSYQKLSQLELPFMSVSGKMKVDLNRCYGIKRVIFSQLQEVGDLVFPSSRNNLETCDFSTLKKIRGSCEINTYNQTNGITFKNLESIGTSGMDHTAIFSLNGGEILCPKLKTIEGNFEVQAGNNAKSTNKISFPNLERISNKLIIKPAAYDNGIITTIAFTNLKLVKAISISEQKNVNDFSSFKYLFENNILTEASQWTVTSCGYNPTFQDMKEGRYTPAE